MPTPIPFPCFQRSLLAVYDGPGHAPRTLAKMRHVLGLLATLTTVSTTADLTTETLARFVRERSQAVCPNTVRSDLSYLSAACGYAVEEGWLDHTPRFRRIRPRPSATRRPRAHPIADVGRVLELLRSRSADWTWHRLYCLAAVAAYAALRRDELLWLRCEDVDLQAGLLRVVGPTRSGEGRRLKTEASAASVPLAPELAEILAGWLPRCGSEWVFPGARKRHHPWTGGANGQRPCDKIRQAGQEVGVEGLTLSSLRHTWATWARRRWHLSALEVQEVLRHTSPRTQRWYLHDDPDPTAIVRSVTTVSYRA